MPTISLSPSMGKRPIEDQGTLHANASTMAHFSAQACISAAHSLLETHEGKHNTQVLNNARISTTSYIAALIKDIDPMPDSSAKQMMRYVRNQNELANLSPPLVARLRYLAMAHVLIALGLHLAVEQC